MNRLLRLAVLACLLLPGATLADALYSRDLHCADQQAGRARLIRMGLQDVLEWTWTGHAIISPSFRMTSAGAREVFCELPITPEDTWTLVGMAATTAAGGFRSVQLQTGALSLLSMLGRDALGVMENTDKPAPLSAPAVAAIGESLARSIAEDSSSIFNPVHPAYILRDGCDARER